MDIASKGLSKSLFFIPASARESVPLDLRRITGRSRASRPWGRSGYADQDSA